MTQTVREFSAVGPCIERGALLRETASFFIVADRFNAGAEIRVGKKALIHTEACPSCRDHQHTQYPNGYDN